MHHCVYTNYYRSIKNHSYIALHMTYPEDCTIGIRLDQKGEPFLHQIYLKYDRTVQPETKEIAKKYISDNSENLKAMLAEKSNTSSDVIDNYIDLVF